MAKTKEQKKEMLNNIEELLSKMRTLVFIDYYGLKVKEIEQLRKILKQKQCCYLVVKKTLLNLVFKKLGLSEKIDLDKIQGGIGLVFGFESETEPAKLVVNFAKKHGRLKIQGGILENSFITPQMIESLSKLPPKEALISQIVSAMKMPINNLIYVLKGNLKKMVYLLSIIKK